MFASSGYDQAIIDVRLDIWHPRELSHGKIFVNVNGLNRSVRVQLRVILFVFYVCCKKLSYCELLNEDSSLQLK